LRLQSPTFNPKTFGEVIDAMHQYDSAAPQLRRSSGNAAFHSRVLLPGEPSMQRLTAASQAPDPRTTIPVASERDSVWPGGTEVPRGEMPVALGLACQWCIEGVRARRARSAPVRVASWRSHPRGARARSTIDRWHGAAGRRLRELDLDLLQEHVTCYALRGGTPACLPVTVASDVRADR